MTIWSNGQTSTPVPWRNRRLQTSEATGAKFFRQNDWTYVVATTKHVNAKDALELVRVAEPLRTDFQSPFAKVSLLLPHEAELTLEAENILKESGLLVQEKWE